MSQAESHRVGKVDVREQVRQGILHILFQLANRWDFFRIYDATYLHHPCTVRDQIYRPHQILFAILFCPSNKTTSEMYIRIRAFRIYRHCGVSLKVFLKTDRERKAFRS